MINEKQNKKPTISSMNAPKPMMLEAKEALVIETEEATNVTMGDLYVTCIADILIKRLKDKKYREFREHLPTKQRRKLLKYYYPLPRWMVFIGWLSLIIISLIGAAFILNYGIKFDILYYANIAPENDIYLQSECSNNLTDISITQLMQYSINQQYINNDFKQPNYRGVKKSLIHGNLYDH